MSVTSLNSQTGNVNLQSVAGTISINTTGAGNINLEASHTGSQGGVLNLGVLPAPAGQQPLTGQLSLQSSGGSIVFTYPDGGYPSGQKINVEAVAGGVVGVNTINNVVSDATHNFTLTAGANVQIASGTNSLTISATDTVGVASLQQNAGTLFTGAVRLVNGTNITMADSGAGQITISSTDTVGVASIQPNPNLAPPGTLIQGAVALIAGSNISLVGNGQNITINASGDGAGIETINGIQPVAGNFGVIAGSGIDVITQANAIEIENNGVLGIIVNANSVPTPPALVANIGLIAGAGITLNEAGQNITITATGDGAGIETINAISGGAGGAFLINAGSGITVTPQTNAIDIVNSGILSIQITGVGTPITGAITLTTGAGITGSEPVPGTIDIVNSGVLSVATGANTPATGAISLVAGSNVTITEVIPGAFTINSSGDGKGIETINTLLPTALGNFILGEGQGMSINPVLNGLEFWNAGVLSVATGANPPAVGAISLVQGTNVTISEAGGAFTINASGGGGGGSYTYTSNVAYPLTDPGGYFHQPVIAPTKYSISDKTALNFFTSTWDLATLTITPDGAGTGLVAGDGKVCGNSTHFFSCPNSWGNYNLTINRYVYSPASQDTIVLGNAYQFTTIYDIAANDTSIYILAQTASGSLSVLAYNLSTTANTRTVALIYDYTQPYSFSFNNLTASQILGVGYISIGINGTFTEYTGTPQTTGIAITLQDTFVSPPTIVFNSDDYYTNSGSSVYDNVNCQYSNQLPSPAYFVSYYNPNTSTSYIDEWDNTGASVPLSSTPVGTLIYHMNNPWNNPPNSFFAQTTLSDGSSGQQVYKTCSPPDANNSSISGLNNADNYSLYGAYGPIPTPTPPIYLSSSLIDDQYLYQQSAFLTLTVINAIPIGATIALEFEVPCSTLVVGPLLYFPVNAFAEIGYVSTLLPGAANIIDVTPSGTATIHIEIYNHILVPVGDAVILTLPQFTILPPPPP